MCLRVKVRPGFHPGYEFVAHRSEIDAGHDYSRIKALMTGTGALP
jgi:hypothetical protein